MKITIIIPVFNEAVYIPVILNTVDGLTIAGYQKEIIVIDDGSTDGTREILRGLKSHYHDVTIVYQDENKGKGAAVQNGINRATGDFIFIQDADLEYQPEDLTLMLQHMEETNADVVFGSRLLHASNNWKYFRGVLNRILSAYVSFLYSYNVTDVATCYKLFRRSFLTNVQLKENGFSIDIELFALFFAKKAHIKEVPIRYFQRSYSQGKKIKLHDGLHFVFKAFQYRFRTF